MWNTNKVVKHKLVLETRPSCWAQEIKNHVKLISRKQKWLLGRMLEENREKKGNRNSSWQKKPLQSPTVMPPLPLQPDGSKCSNPVGCEDFPPWGPIPIAAGRVGRPSLLEAAAAQMLLGAGLRQGKSKRAARARVRMKSAVASGRRRAAQAPWRLPEQSHGSNEVNDSGDGMFSFRYWSGDHRNLTALKELESRVGRGEQRCGFRVGDIVNKEGGEKNKREIKFKESWKRRHSKLYRYTIHR